MMIITVMLVAVFALLFGFLLGLNNCKKPKVKVIRPKVEPNDTDIQKEYENFLNYDGTAQ